MSLFSFKSSGKQSSLNLKKKRSCGQYFKCFLCRGGSFEERAIRVKLWVFSWEGNTANFVFVVCVVLTIFGQLCIPVVIALFLCTGSLELCVFAFNSIHLIASMFSFYSVGGGILGNGNVGLTTFIPFISISFSKWRIHRYFWFSVFSVNLFVSFVLEFFVTDRSGLSQKMLETDFYTSIVTNYFCLVFPLLLSFVVIVIMKCRSDKKLKKLRFVCKTVEALKYDEKEVKKLLSKNETKCSSFERYLIRILKNTNVYSRYVPNVHYMKKKSWNEEVIIPQISVPLSRNGDMSTIGGHSSLSTNSYRSDFSTDSGGEANFFDSAGEASEEDASSGPSSVAYSHEDLSPLQSDGEGSLTSEGLPPSSPPKPKRSNSGDSLMQQDETKNHKKMKNRRYFTLMLISFGVEEGYTTINPFLMDIIMNSLTQFRGALSEVEHGGETVLCSFNAVQKCVNHEERACRCALRITTQIEKFFTNLEKSLDFIRENSERVPTSKIVKKFEFEHVEQDGGGMDLASDVREENMGYEYKIPDSVLKEIDVDIFEAFGGLDYVLLSLGDREFQIPKASITIVSDFGTYGLIGGQTYRKFAFLGENMRCLRKLSRFNLARFDSILINDVTQNAIKFYMRTKVVELGYNVRTQKPFRIFRLCRRQNAIKKKKMKQWLYEVREQVIKPSEEDRNLMKLWTMIEAGNFEGAKEEIVNISDESIILIIQKKIETRKKYGLEF